MALGGAVFQDAAKAVRVNNELRITIGPYEHAVRILALSLRRGPAGRDALYRERVEPSGTPRTGEPACC
jgi:ribosomal 50S subunit-recycling heat shock protein